MTLNRWMRAAFAAASLSLLVAPGCGSEGGTTPKGEGPVSGTAGTASGVGNELGHGASGSAGSGSAGTSSAGAATGNSGGTSPSPR